MRRLVGLTLLLALVYLTSSAYQIIAPTAFSITDRNYLKLQILAEIGDGAADSAVFIISYNVGNSMRVPVDKSLSAVLRLNAFNDGVFYVHALVYHEGKREMLGSVYHTLGIPVILDRNKAFNDKTFISSYLPKGEELAENFRRAVKDKTAGNNNTIGFSSFWDNDSIYFEIDIVDANVNYRNPVKWDLFQKKNYLEALWVSDCIEIGLDLAHDHSQWKQADDYELVIDVKGNFAGNRWSVQDSLFEHWGDRTRVNVSCVGTINNNQDIDQGYTISLAIPWEEFTTKPDKGATIGFDIQMYDKDAELDEAFRTSLSGTNPESNDNTSEWTNLYLTERPSAFRSSWWYGIATAAIVFLIFILYTYNRRKLPKDLAVYDPADIKSVAAMGYTKHTDAALDYIGKNYSQPDLSRHQIADHVFVSEKYLSSLFKKEVGVNLVAYINKHRIDQSVKLLHDTKLTISEIAFKVGYSSLQNFNKNFKVFTGKTPSDFRK